MKSIYIRNEYENYWQQLEEMTSENISLNYLVNEAVKNYAEKEGSKWNSGSASNVTD